MGTKLAHPTPSTQLPLLPVFLAESKNDISKAQLASVSLPGPQGGLLKEGMVEGKRREGGRHIGCPAWVGGLGSCSGVSLHHHSQFCPLESPLVLSRREDGTPWMLTLSFFFLQNEQQRQGDGPVPVLLPRRGNHLRAPVEFSVSMAGSLSLGLAGFGWLGTGWERDLPGRVAAALGRVLGACDPQSWCVLWPVP